MEAEAKKRLIQKITAIENTELKKIILRKDRKIAELEWKLSTANRDISTKKII